MNHSLDRSRDCPETPQELIAWTEACFRRNAEYHLDAPEHTFRDEQRLLNQIDACLGEADGPARLRAVAQPTVEAWLSTPWPALRVSAASILLAGTERSAQIHGCASILTTHALPHALVITDVQRPRERDPVPPWPLVAVMSAAGRSALIADLAPHLGGDVLTYLDTWNRRPCTSVDQAAARASASLVGVLADLAAMT